MDYLRADGCKLKVTDEVLLQVPAFLLLNFNCNIAISTCLLSSLIDFFQAVLCNFHKDYMDHRACTLHCLLSTEMNEIAAVLETVREKKSLDASIQESIEVKEKLHKDNRGRPHSNMVLEY
jgi:hypothetical protein